MKALLAILTIDKRKRGSIVVEVAVAVAAVVGGGGDIFVVFAVNRPLL